MHVPYMLFNIQKVNIKLVFALGHAIQELYMGGGARYYDKYPIIKSNIII